MDAERVCKVCEQRLPAARFPRGHRRFVCRTCFYAAQRRNGNTAHAAMITEARLLAKSDFCGYDTLFAVAGLRCAGLCSPSLSTSNRCLMPRDPTQPLAIPDNICFCSAPQRAALLAVWRSLPPSSPSRVALYRQLLDAFA